MLQNYIIYIYVLVLWFSYEENYMETVKHSMDAIQIKYRENNSKIILHSDICECCQNSEILYLRFSCLAVTSLVCGPWSSIRYLANLSHMLNLSVPASTFRLNSSNLLLKIWWEVKQIRKRRNVKINQLWLPWW